MTDLDRVFPLVGEDRDVLEALDEVRAAHPPGDRYADLTYDVADAREAVGMPRWAERL